MTFALWHYRFLNRINTVLVGKIFNYKQVTVDHIYVIISHFVFMEPDNKVKISIPEGLCNPVSEICKMSPVCDKSQDPDVENSFTKANDSTKIGFQWRHLCCFASNLMTQCSKFQLQGTQEYVYCLLSNDLQDWFIHLYKHVLFNKYLSLQVRTKILSIIMQSSLDLTCSWIQPVLCSVDKESGYVLNSPVGQHSVTYNHDANDPYIL